MSTQRCWCVSLCFMNGREVRGAVLFLLQFQHWRAGAATGMGPLRRHGWLQQNGTPKLSVETLSCQSAVQGGCTRHLGGWCYGDMGFSEGDTEAFVLLLFTGERHVPSRPVRSQVRRPSGHRWQLQIQKQRPISSSVVLLQGKSSMLVALLISLLTLDCSKPFAYSVYVVYSDQ